AGERRIILVDERRPGELEGEGERRIAHQADRRAADPGLAQPCRLRREDQKKRQSRREAERKHQREAGVSEDFTKGGRFADRGHKARMAPQWLRGDRGLIGRFGLLEPSSQSRAPPGSRWREALILQNRVRKMS